jgi:methanogenic corrinoid protein MtbC1
MFSESGRGTGVDAVLRKTNSPGLDNGGKTVMTKAFYAKQSLDFDVLRRTSVRLEKLAKQLPEEAVQSLAHEAIARLSANLRGPGSDTAAPSSDVIERLCAALLSGDLDAGASMVARLQSEGTSIEAIYTVYLAATARRMGEMWENDEISFTAVTVGASRILAIMRGLRETFRATYAFSERSALFVAVPDEQHTIGISMAADLVRKERWDVDLLVGATHDEIIEAVRSSDALVVGLTAHGWQSLAGLLKLIVGIRIVNPAVNILVCGNIVNETEDIVIRTGADAHAGDISTALRKMEEWHRAANAPGAPRL